LVLVACGSAPRTESSIDVASKTIVVKPVEVVGEDIARFELAIGISGFCARLDGKVHCGNGTDEEPIADKPPVGGIEDATSIALGLADPVGCLTTRRGTVHCWGSNVYGQLGAMMRGHSAVPVQVASVTNARQVFVGDEHACATTTEGAIHCWGLNQSGETGGSTSWAPVAVELVTPTEVIGVRDVVTVATASGSTCALTKRREVWCWGSSITGEQRRAQGPQNENAFRLASLTNAEDISGSSGELCAARAGDVFCVGRNDLDEPKKVGGVSDATKVRVGASHACALLHDGSVVCWGDNTAPEPVPGIANARDLVVGRNLSCAITGPETVWCWGVSGEAARVRVR
jgi:alpha-tubulin suppressor-like RCC1 family protein